MYDLNGIITMLYFTEIFSGYNYSILAKFT